MWYVCDVLYAVVYVCVSCLVVRGCAVSRRYIDKVIAIVSSNFPLPLFCTFVSYIIEL